jgi:hypothetical protein
MDVQVNVYKWGLRFKAGWRGKQTEEATGLKNYNRVFPHVGTHILT